MRRIIINTLSRIGYSDVVEGDNGKSGLEKLAQGGIEMIITDWNMPEMDGLEFVQTVRTQNPSIPISWSPPTRPRRISSKPSSPA